MNSYLALHPDIFMATKELHYFSGEAFSDPPIEERDLFWYLSEFKRASSKTLIGEASVFYLSSKTAAYRIKQFNPDAKIVIHVRCPTDLILSHHSALLYGGVESIQDIWQALMAETQRRAGMLAAARIRAYPAALAVLTNEHSLQEHAQCRHAPISVDDSGGTIDPCKRWPLATASGGLRR